MDNFISLFVFSSVLFQSLKKREVIKSTEFFISMLCALLQQGVNELFKNKRKCPNKCPIWKFMTRLNEFIADSKQTDTNSYVRRSLRCERNWDFGFYWNKSARVTLVLGLNININLSWCNGSVDGSTTSYVFIAHTRVRACSSTVAAEPKIHSSCVSK